MEQQVDLAAQVNEAMETVGYAWAGGVVLTNVDDPRAQRLIAANPEAGAFVPTLGAWVSWCTPAGGLEVPADVPIAPMHGKELRTWSTLHAYGSPQCPSGGMLVVVCDPDGVVLYVLATRRSKDHAALLALAALRTVESTDNLPVELENAVLSPPARWSEGWSIDRTEAVSR